MFATFSSEPGQPVLQREEIGPDVLRRSGNEAQQARHAAQHRHLLGAGTRQPVLACSACRADASAAP